MKPAGYILAFYLILLSAIPCCAFDDCPDDEMNSSATEQSASHENDDDNCGTCSPFFSCEGCATATIDYYPVPFEFSILPSSPVYTTYLPALLQQMNADVWQPPKLS